MATFWDRAAHTVDVLIVFFIIFNLSHSRFGFEGFEGAIWVVLAPVSGHCILVTFILKINEISLSYLNLQYFDAILLSFFCIYLTSVSPKFAESSKGGSAHVCTIKAQALPS